jgi:guanylate kinase
LKDEGFFAETACYNGWFYGTAKKDCTNNRVAVLTPHGMRQLKKIEGIDIISFYICVPRRDRLIKILERGDNIEEAYRRNLSDVGQYDGIKDEVDCIIKNPNYMFSIDEMTQALLQTLDTIRIINKTN